MVIEVRQDVMSRMWSIIYRQPGDRESRRADFSEEYLETQIAGPVIATVVGRWFDRHFTKPAPLPEGWDVEPFRMGDDRGEEDEAC